MANGRSRPSISAASPVKDRWMRWAAPSSGGQSPPADAVGEPCGKQNVNRTEFQQNVNVPLCVPVPAEKEPVNCTKGGEGRGGRWRGVTHVSSHARYTCSSSPPKIQQPITERDGSRPVSAPQPESRT